jgi:hypothetical protein
MITPCVWVTRVRDGRIVEARDYNGQPRPGCATHPANLTALSGWRGDTSNIRPLDLSITSTTADERKCPVIVQDFSLRVVRHPVTSC